jgi:uncharacterized repeat protein (TIGR01451 family)
MKLINKIRSLSKKSKLLVAALAAGVTIAAPLAVNAGFFPGRPTYDYNKSGNGNCDDTNNPARDYGRCGSMNGPVFNSFVNAPFAGDERYFADGRRTDQPVNTTSDTIKDVTDSKQVTLRVYIHNNANQDTNCLREHLTANGCTQIDQTAPGVAHNTKVSIELPTETNSALRAVGAVSADNAAPKEVTDTVYLTGTRKFKVEYVQNSARLLRGSTSYPLGNEVVTGGVLVGDKPMANGKFDGNFPGCFDYASFVEITVNIIPEASNKLQVMKEVKKLNATPADTTWHKEVIVKPGDQAQYLLTTKNIGLDTLTNTQIRDILPPHVQLVKDSIQLVNADQSTYTQPNEPLFGNGTWLGTYPSGGGRYVLFKVTALNDFDGCEIRVRNQAKAKADQVPTEISDYADVVIKKENCNQTTPTYSCDALTKVQGDNRSAKFTVNASAAGGATITRYFFNFGDNTQEFVTDKNVAEHTYAKDGQYAVQSRVEFRVNGELKTANGSQCATAVTFTTPPTTPPVKPATKTTTTLPNTGPGDVVAVFVGVVTASTAAYYVVIRRLQV